MTTSAILFIDSSNLYHALKTQGDLPFDADKFKALFEALSQQYNLKKVYFYDAVKNSEKDPLGYSRQQSFHERLKKTHSSMILRTRKLKYVLSLSDNQIFAAAKKIGILESCWNKLKRFLIELNLIKLTKEKGIDVLLVVDAIEEARAKSAEAIIILSGDADLVPAVHIIKDYGLKTVNLHTYSGSSTELRKACARHILISFDENGILLK